MILLLPAVVLAALFVLGRRRDVRRLRNGVYLVCAVGCVLLAVCVEALRRSPSLEIVVYLLGALGVGLVGLLAVFLVGNGVTMLRTEGRTLGNLLSLLAGVAIVVVPVVAVLLSSEVAPRWLPSWLRVLLVATGLLLLLACAYGAVSFAAFAVCSVVYSSSRRTTTPDVLVVLGSRLICGEVPPLLRSRLDKALATYRSVPQGYPRPVIVPSGGQGADESRPEGEAMAEYLIAHGAAPGDVHPETRSTTTRENLVFSAEVARTAGRTGSTLVVTNSYHVLRAAILARSTGSDAQVVGSRTAAYYVPSAFLREYVAIMVENRRFNGAAAATFTAVVGLGVVWSLVPA